jgi:hypothetical protein
MPDAQEAAGSGMTSLEAGRKRHDMPSRIEMLAGSLTDASLPLPVPVAKFVEGISVPLAIDTRSRLTEWCAARGYSADQRLVLDRIIQLVVTRDRYRRAVASGCNRMDLDGEDAGPVSENDRAYATKKLAKQPKSEPEPRPKPEQAAAIPIETVESEWQTAATPTTVPPGPREREPEPQSPKNGRTDTLAGTPNSPTVVVVRPRRALASRPAPAVPSRPAARPAASQTTRPAAALLPAIVIREAVERTGGRRNALRLIGVHFKAGRHAGVAAERAAWANDAVVALVGDGHDRAVCESQVAQMIDDLLTGVVPRQAR